VIGNGASAVGVDESTALEVQSLSHLLDALDVSLVHSHASLSQLVSLVVLALIHDGLVLFLKQSKLIKCFP